MCLRGSPKDTVRNWRSQDMNPSLLALLTFLLSPANSCPRSIMKLFIGVINALRWNKHPLFGASSASIDISDATICFMWKILNGQETRYLTQRKISRKFLGIICLDRKITSFKFPHLKLSICIFSRGGIYIYFSLGTWFFSNLWHFTLICFLGRSEPWESWVHNVLSRASYK